MNDRDSGQSALRLGAVPPERGAVVRPPVSSCWGCGTTIIQRASGPGRRRRWCSQRCKIGYEYRAEEVARSPRLGVCVVCTASFNAPGQRGAVPKTCSDDCRRRWASIRNVKQTVRKRALRLATPLVCAACGAEFFAVRWRRLCSPGCYDRGGIRAATLRKHGLAKDDYRELYEKQAGRCAICSRTPEDARWRGRGVLQVDHDHITGEVRGLLCGPCNTGIGALGDTTEAVEAALRYLTGKGPQVFKSALR